MPHEILGPVAPPTLIYPEYLPRECVTPPTPPPPYYQPDTFPQSLLHGTPELSLSGQGNPKPPPPLPPALSPSLLARITGVKRNEGGLV